MITSWWPSAPEVKAAPPVDPAVLAKTDVRQALALANEWKWSQPAVKSFITSREIVFQFPDGSEKKILLPPDKMMVAVAPYLTQTHTWTVHFMSSCQGELAEKNFQVKAVDQKGKVLMDGPVSTLKNGFMELWLPRARRIELTIKGFQRTAEGIIETHDNSPTCITTMQLK
jgi:hypothetical protein